MDQRENIEDRPDDQGREGSGEQAGMAEHSGLEDRKAKEGRDTAAALQDEQEA